MPLQLSVTIEWLEISRKIYLEVNGNALAVLIQELMNLGQGKAGDMARAAIENRLLSLESRVMSLATSAFRTEKSGASSFQQQLAESSFFNAALRKVDANSVSNLKRLEDYFGEQLGQCREQFAQVQQRMLDMIIQKEKILRNLNFEVENQGHAIAAVEQWMKSSHAKENSLCLLEESLRSRLEVSQRNTDLKQEIIEERVKYLQQLNVSARSERLREIEGINTEIDRLRKRAEQRKEANLQQLAQRLGKLEKNGSVRDLEREVEQIRAKLARFGSRVEQIEEGQNGLRARVESGQEPIKTQEKERGKQRQISSVSEKKSVEVSSKNLFSQEAERNQKKPLLSRKPPLIQQPNLQADIEDMRGGIRGLLKKSKQKERGSSGKQSDLNPKSSKKGLPPVKEDPFSRKMKDQTFSRRQEPEPEEEGDVCLIDEEGYVMDEEGNYLVNENGEMIRLSPEQIDQYA